MVQDSEQPKEARVEYAGVSHTPSPYDCQDGQLDCAMGLVNEDGAIRPLQPPVARLTLASTQRVVFIHKTATYEHLLVADTATDSLVWIDEAYCSSEETWLADSSSDEYAAHALAAPAAAEANSFAAIGNTIAISTADAVHYVLWKSSDDNYTCLGTRIPEVKAAFSLYNELTSKTYTDLAVTIGDGSSTATPDGAWTTLYSFTATQKNTESGDRLVETPYIPGESISLEAGREYKLVIQYSTPVSNAKNKYVRLYDSEGNGLKKSKVGATLTTFTPDTDCTVGYFIVDTSLSSGCSLTFTVTLYKGYEEIDLDGRITLTSDGYNALLGTINNFRETYFHEKDKFLHPFFLRYGVKLYSGDIVNLSPPILLVPNSGYAPLIRHTEDSKAVTLSACAASITYKLLNEPDEAWADIIQGLAVYVSQPIYPYAQGRAYNEHASEKDLFAYLPYDVSDSDNPQDPISGTMHTYGVLDWDGIIEASSSPFSDPHERTDIGAFIMENTFGCSTATVMRVAQKDSEQISKEYTEVAAFYQIADIPFDELKMPVTEVLSTGTYTASSNRDDDFNSLNVEPGALASLVSRTPLEETALPYSAYCGMRLHAYNNRLHIFGGDCALPDITDLSLQSTFVTPKHSYQYIRVRSAYVYVRTSDGDRVQYTEFDSIYRSHHGMAWFFYPNNNAYQVVLYCTETNSGQKFHILLPLTQHPYLNGAYYWSGDVDTPCLTWDGTTSTEPYTTDEQAEAIYDDPPTVNPLVTSRSSIFVSEADNPFTFLATNEVSIGAANVLSLASATQAISQGQFGTFPLYAFTDEGIWMLETANTGVYVARQPVARDVLTDPLGTLQLDNAVAFTTNRGVMLIAGSTCKCLTDALNTKEQQPFLPASLPSFDDMAELAGMGGTDCFAFVPLQDFLNGARMLYDYTHQRIFLYNPSHAYAYVYSVGTGLWGMAQSTYTATLNAYPEGMAMGVDEDGYPTLYDFSTTDNTDALDGLLLTRPIKLGAPDTLKTLRTAMQRGYFDTGNVKTAIYGTRDYKDWHLLASRAHHDLRRITGTPYKAFRILLLTQLAPDESVSAASIEFVHRHTNNMR